MSREREKRDEKVHSSGFGGKHSSIAVNSNNLPLVSYYDSTNGDLEYTKKVGDGWVKKLLIQQAMLVGI
jgi:hypothetical protein